MIIQNLISSTIAQNYHKINDKNTKKSMERLSSGYKVNKAADNSATLSISEKMRSQIRGLDRGTLNASDAISWIHTGEGALNEITEIMHRMKEVTVYALNDTMTPADRAALQMEFDQLQSEIDKIALTTEFNTQCVFEEHEPTYYSIKGNRQWEQNEFHFITTTNNSLTINYKKTSDSPTETFTVKLPAGRYTTQELMDEIDDAMISQGGSKIGFNIEYTDYELCNLNYEGGEDIVGLSGGLSYLFYHSYDSGSMGELLGTTLFYDGSPLHISNENNELNFTLVDFFGNERDVNIVLSPGYYDRQQIIDILNDKLTQQGLTNVVAKTYGDNCIQIASEDYFVMGLKGNMFKIDDPTVENIYSSIFYDNIKYGTVKDAPAYLKGGAVLTTNSNDTDHNRFVITDDNNTLVLSGNESSFVTITLANGSYTAASMASLLTSAFSSNSIGLTATAYTEGNYYGIRIDSQISGVNSDIEFNLASSSAYNTLFRECSYANILNKSPVNGAYSYSAPSVLGGASLEFPLELNNGNNKFNLTVGSDTYTIELTENTYNSISDLIAEIHEQLNGANAEEVLKNKITVSSTADNRIELKPASGSEITLLKVSSVTGNTGYNNLFVGSRTIVTHNSVSGTGTTGTTPQISLNIPPSGTIIDSSNDTLVVTIDGIDRTVTLNHGEINDTSINNIVNNINTQLIGSTTEVEKSFSTGTAYGSDRNQVLNASGGIQTNASFNTTVKGTGVQQQGSTETGHLTPATFTVPINLPTFTTIDSSNNQFTCVVNGNTVTLTLDDGTYDRTQLANEIQKQFNREIPGYIGVDVSLVGNRLNFTTRLSGENSSLRVYSTGGSFMNDLCTTETAAVATFTTAQLNNSITIDNSNNQFKFKLNGTDISVTLTNGTYNTRSDFINALNQSFMAQGLGVTASLSSNYLRLTTTAVGSNAGINISTSTVSDNPNSIFTNLTTPATCTIPLQIQDNITIDSSSNIFSLNIDGQEVTVTLDNGTYTPSTLLTALNNKLSGKAVVALNSKQLTFTTVSSGSSSRINISSSGGGNSMPAIFGKNQVVTSAVTASVSPDNSKLILTGSETGTSKSVNVNSGKGTSNSLFIKPTLTDQTVNPTTVTGSLSSQKAYIQGAVITEPIILTSLNNKMSFNYNGSSRSISLNEGTYTYTDLQQSLQDAVNASVGNNSINVTVNSSGVRLEAASPHNTAYNMSNFSGGFYRYVIAGSTINTSYKNVTYIDGGQNISSAYAIGRQDVRNNSVQIMEGSNDELSLDLTIEGSIYTFEMKLDEGTYQGNSLAKHIQSKLNEALVKSGFPANMVQATIGGVDSGVAGANDNNALIFSLSTDMILDKNGKYVIDGVSGSASFYVFYKTDGSPIPTYIQGAKDISKGVSVTDENNTFSFVANDVEYEYTLPSGDYTAEEIIDLLNNLISSEPDPPPIVALYTDNNLKLSFTKFGNNTLHSISGLSKGDLFYQELGRIKDETAIKIQLSGNTDDSTSINKPRVTTIALGINSIVITKLKYANKALERIDIALNKILSKRTYYGAGQNRLEHVTSVNDIVSENTQASESAIRDTNMANEIMTLAKSNILMQVSQAMLAQANNQASNVLNLLK